MAAYDVNDFTQTLFGSYTYVDPVDVRDFSTFPGVGPIPYVAAYFVTDTAYYVVVQADRALVTLAATTVASNYTIAGTSPPTVTAAAFTNGNPYVLLTLSGAMTSGTYTLALAERTILDAATNYNAFPRVVNVYDASHVCSGVTASGTFNGGYGVRRKAA